MLAVLDDTDYRLAEEAARQQLVAATTQARQAESDRQRLEALKTDGSVSVVRRREGAERRADGDGRGRGRGEASSNSHAIG